MLMAEESGTGGVLLGLALGLLGIGVALAFFRPKCPRCTGRVENGAHYCPSCGVMLAWPRP